MKISDPGSDTSKWYLLFTDNSFCPTSHRSAVTTAPHSLAGAVRGPGPKPQNCLGNLLQAAQSVNETEVRAEQIAKLKNDIARRKAAKQLLWPGGQ